MNNENSITLAFKKEAPEAENPIRGGIAPTRAPGIIDNGVIFFRRVYTILYKKALRAPNKKGTNPAERSRKLPATKKKTDARKAFLPEIFFAGIGLFLVLFIIESASLSVYWFIAADPEERKNTPAATTTREPSDLFPDSKYPVTADSVTAAESLYFARSAYDRIVSIILFTRIKGLHIFGYRFYVSLFQ
jgi:hypothetical protein